MQPFQTGNISKPSPVLYCTLFLLLYQFLKWVLHVIIGSFASSYYFIMNFKAFDALFKPSAPANAKRIFFKGKTKLSRSHDYVGSLKVWSQKYTLQLNPSIFRSHHVNIKNPSVLGISISCFFNFFFSWSVFRILGNPVDDLSKFGAAHIQNEGYNIFI